MYSSYTILYCTVLYFCTVFVPPFTTGVLSPFHYFVLYLYHYLVLYLYYICITILYYVCTTVYIVFVLYLYHNPLQESFLLFTAGYLSSQCAYQSINQSVGRCRCFLPGWYCSVHSLLLLSAILFSILPSCRSESSNPSINQAILKSSKK